MPAPWNKSADRHVAPLGHIILMPSQLVFALSPQRCVLSGEATHTNFIVFDLSRSMLKPTIYCTRGEHANNYTTDAVYKISKYDTKGSGFIFGDDILHIVWSGKIVRPHIERWLKLVQDLETFRILYSFHLTRCLSVRVEFEMIKPPSHPPLCNTNFPSDWEEVKVKEINWTFRSINTTVGKEMIRRVPSPLRN